MNSVRSSALSERPTPAVEKEQELQEVEDILENLRFRLVEVERRRDNVQKELALLRVTRPGIHSLPPELLCAIFFGIKETQALRNHKLSLVCKAWRVLINGTPHFWTQITVEWPRELRQLTKIWNYVKICREKSGNVPLHVTVDLMKLPSLAEYLTQLLNNHFNPLNLDPYGLLPQWMEFKEHGVDMVECDRYGTLLENTMRKVIGDGSGFASRLKILRLLVPYHVREANMEQVFNKILDGSAEMAELEFRVGGAGSLIIYQPVTVYLPPFPALTKLKTAEDVRFPTDSPVSPILEDLELTNQNAVIHFLVNAGSSFSALTSLSLSLWGPGWTSLLIDMVSLSSLRTIKLISDIHWEVMSLINAPNLHSLHLDGLELSEYPELPILSELQAISFEAKFWTELPLTVSAFEAVFSKILVKSPNLISIDVNCHLAIRGAVLQLTKKAVQEVSASGTLLALATNGIHVIGRDNLSKLI